jgi:geranylgeranyl reductase family protein
MKVDAQVAVIGAGPGGCAVAARLAQRGLAADTLVLERYRFPRDKPCGGALTGHIEAAMAAVGLVIDVPVVESPDARVRFFDFERTVAMGKPVRMIRRREYDASLARQTGALGVEIREGTKVTGLRRAAGGAIEIEIAGAASIRCRAVIGADGAASVARKFLLGNDAVPHRLFMAELAAPAELAGDSRMLYDFSPMADDLRGYQWIFPSPEGRINVGLMHYPAFRRGGRSLVDLLREHLRPLGVELEGARGWPVWGYHPKTPLSAAGVLLVGDAAGIDGLTGEGIAVAMEQGAVAADLVAGGLESGDLGFAGYTRTIRKAVVGRELALDRLLARLLYRWPTGDRGWLNWLSLVLCDSDVIEMYARRVDGTEILADQKLRLFRALFRHLRKRGARIKELGSIPWRGAAGRRSPARG